MKYEIMVVSSNANNGFNFMFFFIVFVAENRILL
jgi:hypothetical protein